MSRFCLLLFINLNIDCGKYFSTSRRRNSIDISVSIRRSHNLVWISISPGIVCWIYCHHVVRRYEEWFENDLHSISNNQRLQRLVVGRMQIFKSFSGPVEPIMNYASTQKTYGMRNTYGELIVAIWLEKQKNSFSFSRTLRRGRRW